MIARLKRCWSRLAIACAAAFLLVAAQGCKLDRLRGEGFKGETKEWGKGLRPEGSPEDHAGLSAKAQEIERHLGS